MSDLIAIHIVRDIVGRHAPAEVEHFDAVTELLLTNPDLMYAGDPDRGELAADLGELLVIVVPVLYAALNDLVRDSTTAGAAALRRAARNRLYLSRINALPEGADCVRFPHLRADTIRRLLAHNVAPDKASAIADDLCAALAGR